MNKIENKKIKRHKTFRNTTNKAKRKKKTRKR